VALPLRSISTARPEGANRKKSGHQQWVKLLSSKKKKKISGSGENVRRHSLNELRQAAESQRGCLDAENPPKKVVRRVKRLNGENLKVCEPRKLRESKNKQQKVEEENRGEF